jgi:hypothetical protein
VIGDGSVARACRTVFQQGNMFDPPLETEANSGRRPSKHSRELV